ncbi:hypothetical protein [Acidisoma sp.]|uniref:hypothetical protein n=1 Tax=Acidisoma sp. TaxID=1872115 RepID=UPI003AFF9C1E
MLDSIRPDFLSSDYAEHDRRQHDRPIDDFALTAPSHPDGTLVDRALCPADDQEVVRQMTYVLRSWPGTRGRRRTDDALARITAERLVDYLHLSGFELMKRPMVTDTGYVGGDR